MEDKTEKSAQGGLNKRMFAKLIVVAVVMFGFGWALIPVYKRICQLTGVNVIAAQESENTRADAVDNSQVDKTRMITVEFDANTQGPFRFRPTVNSLKVHPGEMTTVVYEVVNKQPRTVEAQAIPSYAPQQAAQYFKKVECFCFRQQTLKPGEAREMPVLFYLDPKLPRHVQTITLSYTFFEVAGHSGKAE